MYVRTLLRGGEVDLDFRLALDNLTNTYKLQTDKGEAINLEFICFVSFYFVLKIGSLGQ